ncbi:DNA replication/repair protein RecF [Weissella muntiaci]|uniref:DNA replication and repair protein RecF n=1 Tax=Weissella muntiaci TaxID=2508881 RepID=A0A6C2C531_9LACO|nr:DNA replication/repair protein RecF [Weissella muntiaci]TYC49111.1 DNA replication/repair protein RecF [Weissella muntiaci]
MWLENLQLQNFRNYEAVDIDFTPGVNIFLGSNAQGKTNLLEAIYALALTRSHRTTNDKDLIGWEGKTAKVSGVVERRLGKLPLEIDFTTKGKKARMNHLDQAKLANYVGQMNVILFAPEDLALIKGAPALRRNFIDREFSQMSPKYLYVANQYRAILKQRNQYLKQLQNKKSRDLLYLEVLTEQLSGYATELIIRRLVLVERLARAAKPIHAAITQELEQLDIKYISQLSEEERQDQETIKSALLARYIKLQEREIFMGTTLLGPHRDDLQFLVNDHDVAEFGSQGQQRTAALALKLAEIDLMKEETDEYPILLLDDVLSELDTVRQTHLLMAMQDKVQTFLTTPSLSDVARQLIKEPKIFKVQAGTLNVVEEDGGQHG